MSSLKVRRFRAFLHLGALPKAALGPTSKRAIPWLLSDSNVSHSLTFGPHLARYDSQIA